MGISLRLLLLIIALILFVLAGLDVRSSRVNLTAMGLAAFTLAEMVAK